MSASLDRAQIRRAFGRAAATYAAHAVLQAEVGTRLRERLDADTAAPAVVLDVGCGPGTGTAALQALFPAARIVALDLALPMLDVARRHPDGSPTIACVCADAQRLPLTDASVDLVYSNLCLHWCEDPGRALEEFRRVLRPGGRLLVSTFGPDTLQELRAAFARADASPRVSQGIDMHDLGDALLAIGLRDPVLERDDFTLTYRDARTLMRELRASGATHAEVGRRRTLTGKARLHAATAAYEAFRRDGVLPATFEVVYAHARAPDSGQPRHSDDGDIACFPVEHLRASRRR
ncbi:MAG: malonyl-ACP O-methyltransferase BioC [Rhodanobacter sp.]|jgi:malonyl-CoA O-methyltransferase|nr:malonyl-ACP O-methyltransferase BioC [Rhodanobacter sp.]